MADWPKFLETGEKETCCGCTACKEICPVHAIQMRADEEGFLYPQLNATTCIHCKSCQAVCPFSTLTNFATPKSVWAAVHKDREVLLRSSSGGAFTAFSDAVLDQGGFVAGVILQNNIVRHYLANSKQLTAQMCGSKYVQSELSDIIQQIREEINQQHFVLFTGTPCQSSGVRNVIGETDNLVTLDFVCHGVPSPAVWKDYVTYKENIKHTRILFTGFRAKFPHKMGCYETFKTEDGQNGWLPAYESPYLTGFLKGMLSRPSCYSCPYSQKLRASDLTICDYWGYEKHHSEFDPAKGISAILINSKRGQTLFDKAASRMNLHQTTLEQVAAGNANLNNATQRPPERADFFKDRKSQSFHALAQRYLQDPQAAHKRFIEKIPYQVKRLLKKLWRLVK